MMGMLGGRLLAISGFLILLSFVFKQDGIAFYAFIAFAYIITIPYSLWMRNQQRMRRLAPLQFLVDLILVSGLVYFAGGRGHDFLILLYPLIIFSAGIILPIRQTIQITVLSIISYILIIMLMSQNILIDYSANGNSEQLMSTTGAMLLRISIFIMFGIASAYVSRRCDYINNKEMQFSSLTTLVFEHVKTGLLLLDPNDNIIMANSRACEMLGNDDASLVGTSLSAIHLKPSELNGRDNEMRGASDYFRRADESVFPVSIETAGLSLPSDAIPHARESNDTLIDARIVNFMDLSQFLHLQSQTSQFERLKAASDMAREMAHQIRTPLTGISGAVQLLNLNLNGPETIDTKKERAAICQMIISESTRLDKIIQNFLDYSEFSPQELRDLVQTDILHEMEPAGEVDR